MQLETTAAIARDLIRFDTTNYGEGNAKGETEAAEYLGAHLERLGLSTAYVDAAPGRTSVVARVPGTDSSKPALVVHGHTDVVPADPANWSVDPFEGVIRDGMLWIGVPDPKPQAPKRKRPRFTPGPFWFRARRGT